jgi:hypothetical protein
MNRIKDFMKFKTARNTSVALVIGLTMSLVGVAAAPSSVSAQANVPTRTSDCNGNNWRNYNLGFESRQDCVRYVQDHNANNNGYGGGGGGVGGSIGQLISQIFKFIGNLFAAIFAFLGGIFFR